YIGKEYDTENGLNWYDVEARMMDGLRFTTMDPLAEKYYSISPYAYGMGNPMKFVDRNGLYPESILQYDPNLGLYEGYRFTALAAQLLSFVSGVSRVYIDNAIVQERKPGQYRPLYPANKSGGAITIGHSIGVTITYTENWFDDDPSSYNGHGYGQNIYAWLSLSAHEIGHIPQIGKLGGIMGYLYEFVKQYAKYGHDAAPLEKEAEKGRTEFKEFYKFANTTYGQNSIESLFNSKDTEGQKMYTLNSWWNSYQEYMNKKTVSFIGNFQNLQLGVYTWNGVDWTP
ncbi:MAG: hypothetical protein LBN29_08540, partial [Mediterranea sp.]|nr:hypothetical protein [Mediterranea sp.]